MDDLMMYYASPQVGGSGIETYRAHRRQLGEGFGSRFIDILKSGASKAAEMAKKVAGTEGFQKFAKKGFKHASRIGGEALMKTAAGEGNLFSNIREGIRETAKRKMGIPTIIEVPAQDETVEETLKPRVAGAVVPAPPPPPVPGAVLVPSGGGRKRRKQPRRKSKRRRTGFFY